MAKGKNLNPADAYRKSLRKKELKKNKAERSKAREFALVKKDTRELEEDIQKLETATELTPADRTRLTSLKSELEAINKKKEQYVEEHPEHRKLVYKHRRQGNEEKKEVIPQKRNLFKKNGLPRHPERSIYYDPVMNPFGVAPPGMPYVERPLRPDEIESEEEDDDDDDDIVMPDGPPPGVSNDDEEEDSDDDIPMPEGPPPNVTSGGRLNVQPPLSVSLPPPGLGHGRNPPPLPPLGPPRLPGFTTNNLPFPTPGYAPPPPPPFPIPNFRPGHMLPPPGPPQHAFPIFPSHPPPLGQMVPPGFPPQRQQSASSMQDPLSSVPHQTFQAHRDARSTHAPQPPNPILPISAGATLSVAPQLRDLKKEATAFVPTSVKRKKAGLNSSSSSKVNAAPSVDSASAEPVAGPSRPDLLATLKNQFGPVPGQDGGSKGGSTAKAKMDDYERFKEEMGDIL